MSLNITGILDAVVSHAMSLGLFERVNAFEATNAPGHGLTAAVWVQDITPVPARSGLSSTSIRVGLTVRIYSSMLADPPDAIDPEMVATTDALMGAYTGDFELGGMVANVDLLGAYGAPLRAQAGYLPMDSTLFRIMDIALPLIVNDVWEQVP